MNRVIIVPDTWPPVKDHNIPIAEPEPPPPFGTRRPCAGCGLPAARGSRWCATCRADSPAVQPTDAGHAPSRRTYIAAVTRRQTAARRYARLLAGQCPACGRVVGDDEIWCVGHAPERGM